MKAEAIEINPAGELASRLSLGVQARKSSPFALGLREAAVESLPGMAKAAAQSGTRNSKLTPAQLEARAQQRIEDDELIR
ncbi:MAG TPA: sigma-70 family RNA polymerase sigma factor, partial [Edaphobacter sp.]|nr:sigma-70 family RNA polymerase sigma factor [Edaphobacter sp.]